MSLARQNLALSEPVAGWLLLLLSIACAGLLFAQERSVAALELPSLSLPNKPIATVLRSDAEVARKAPSTPRSVQLESLFMEQGAAESLGVEDADSYRNRRKALELGYRALVREVGEPQALRLRAKAVEQLEAALELRLPEKQAKAVLGSLPSVLEREGASRNGRLVAPHFVVRTLYKARWNILHGLAPDVGFERIEKRAFYGWQALHSERVPLPRRIEALHTYGLAGGDQLEEALGVLLFRMGDYAQSAHALEAAYLKQGTLRLRNSVIGARIAAGVEN